MTDPRLDPLLQNAVQQLVNGVAQALTRTGTQLGMLALASNSNAERQTLMNAEYDLQRRMAGANQAFARDLGERVARELQSHAPAGASLADTDWTALRLVDDAEIEQGVIAARLSRSLEAETDAEVRELSGYFATLQDAAADDEVFPLRPAVVGGALMKAVAHASDDAAAQQVVAKVLGGHATAALKDCYAHLLRECRALGVQAAPMAVRRTSGASTASAALDSTAGGLGGARSSHGALQAASEAPWRSLGNMFGLDGPLGAGTAMEGGMGPDGGAATGAGAFAATGQGGLWGAGHGAPAAHRAFVAGEGAGPGGSLGGSLGGSAGGGAGASAPGDVDSSLLGLMRKLQNLSAMTPAWAPSGAMPMGAPVMSDGGLVLPNLIRAHREELVQASGGTALDQMVIDIVATLFDQVLSDPKVPPQMARQIGRLQLPVLRVALRDQTFFHTRRHPVRRFINRMATLATSFEGLEEGPGRECVEMVTALVRDIVEGDFDRLDLYEAKLGELERFVAQQTAREAEEHADIATLFSRREAELRVQQRYMRMIQEELSDLEVPEFLKTFLAQIWTQVQVMAAVRHGADSDKARRMKQASNQLIMSVQPKGQPALRQEFLRLLPQLMKSLNEGLDMIQWPAPAKEAFFAQLLPLHAEALKAPPPHELTLRLLEQRLRKVEQIAIPSREEAANDPLPVPTSTSEPGPLALATALTPQEAQAAGWVSEAAVQEEVSSGGLDIDLSAGDEPDLATVDLEIPLDVPAPPVAGPSLVNFIQAGAAYRMLLKGQWKKVRLTWVSEGRTFFIFTHGHNTSKQTISLTARTLAQMCESGRFKAFEQAQLLERATIRARRQLAALSQQRKAAA